jgi:hypothetical protein
VVVVDFQRAPGGELCFFGGFDGIPDWSDFGGICGVGGESTEVEFWL